MTDDMMNLRALVEKTSFFIRKRTAYAWPGLRAPLLKLHLLLNDSFSTHVAAAHNWPRG
ncbi:hypothetical protein [Sinorhizobium meliloti]|uniref:hypothetical protein n=1 Tax=Rhizobium meliloti TaxID=382 RepID=UPI0003745BA8|nr:hypothetical protein [Sinorhizobium meliloti]